jgi:hypothetical protein
MVEPPTAPYVAKRAAGAPERWDRRDYEEDNIARVVDAGYRNDRLCLADQTHYLG